MNFSTSMDDLPKFKYVLSFYFSIIFLIFHYILFILNTLNKFPISITFNFFKCTVSRIFQAPLIIVFIDTMLSLYFHLCNLSPCTIDLDDQTTVHFWTPKHRKFDRRDLVMIHGFGGNSKWQFVYQVGSLSTKFNLYVPDLLFFGKSLTNSLDRTDVFQAKCTMEGTKRLGVERFSVYGISYGGFVAYHMAKMYPQEVEKVVILNSGICYTEDQKERHLKRIGRSIAGILVPESPEDLRLLVNLSVNNDGFINWAPDFLLRQFIKVMYDSHRKGQLELAEYLLAKDVNTNMISSWVNESLIIWGDQDTIFPVELAHQLHRSLGPKSRLVIIKDTGHAANLQSPHELNDLIKAFV